MARSILPVSKLHARRHKRIVRAVVILLALTVILCAVIVSLFWLPVVRLHNVNVSGAQGVSVERITAAAEGALAGNIAFVFPKNSVFFYSKDAVVQALHTAFPALRDITVSLENLHTLHVAVVERQPVALWCGESIASSSSCFLIDSGGIAYASAPEYSTGVYVRYYGAVASSTPKQFLTTGSFGSLAALVGAIGQKIATTSIASVVVDGEQDASLAFDNGCELFFSLRQDASDVLNNFSLVLQSDVFARSSLSDFQYLDLRFGDRLYYKLK